MKLPTFFFAITFAHTIIATSYSEFAALSTLRGGPGTDTKGFFEQWKVTRNKSTNTFSGTRYTKHQTQREDTVSTLSPNEAMSCYIILCKDEEVDEILDLPEIKRICFSTQAKHGA
jgi:hypothetical protein